LLGLIVTKNAPCSLMQGAFYFWAKEVCIDRVKYKELQAMSGATNGLPYKQNVLRQMKFF
jgi:hypothetical protein